MYAVHPALKSSCQEHVLETLSNHNAICSQLGPCKYMYMFTYVNVNKPVNVYKFQHFFETFLKTAKDRILVSLHISVVWIVVCRSRLHHCYQNLQFVTSKTCTRLHKMKGNRLNGC